MVIQRKAAALPTEKRGLRPALLVILIDETGRVEFATPNAFNALHRLGIYTSAEGHTLGELGVRARVIERSLEFGIPMLEEIDVGHDDVLERATPAADGRERGSAPTCADDQHSHAPRVLRRRAAS